MSEANYVLGHLYFVEQARKSGLYRSGRMTALAPQEIWKRRDIVAAGIGLGCARAMYER